jgi:radical SAM protein with 4Fe4S-binding SPASM domain
LNAGFWGNDYQRRNFEQWTETIYIPGVKKLAGFWVDQMEEKGVVLKLYPLLGIADSLLHEEKNCFMRCGGGWINYAIQTDGYIIPCPTMWGMKKCYLGHISNADPLKIKKIFVDQPPCANCSILNICGGRCLYANVTKRWSDEAYGKVCHTVAELVEAVKAEVPRIQRLLKNEKVHIKDFDFIKYNGCEIIP